MTMENEDLKNQLNERDAHIEKLLNDVANADNSEEVQKELKKITQ
jgi:hypothetical protein